MHGYADFYDCALPILSNYRLSATLYIATGFVERTSLWLRWREEIATPYAHWDQIVEVSDSGIECGAHTHSHPQLHVLPLNRVRDEIGRSKDLLEQHMGREVTSFAYPYGDYSWGVRRLVKDAGFTSACAVNDAMCTNEADIYTLERLMVRPSMDMNAFDALLAQKEPSQLRKAYRSARMLRLA